MEDDFDTLLLRIRMIREDLEAGRLSKGQVQRYRTLGEDVERATRFLDALDGPLADIAWREGVDLIRSFLDEHFPAPTRH